MPTARYDGQTEWYEAYTSADVFSNLREFAVELLGRGPGDCLDLGCGTGRAIPPLVHAGWSVVGNDISIDQLEAAQVHAGDGVRLVHADAHALPFDDGMFDAVVSILTHTDFDDPQAVFREAGRVLRSGGTFVYLGVHPCFGSPFVQRRENDTTLLHPGYRTVGWQRHAPGVSSAGVRAHVGINHVPLAGLFNTIISSGFTITQVEEPGGADPPIFLAVKSTKPRSEPGSRFNHVRAFPAPSARA